VNIFINLLFVGRVITRTIYPIKNILTLKYILLNTFYFYSLSLLLITSISRHHNLYLMNNLLDILTIPIYNSLNYIV